MRRASARLCGSALAVCLAALVTVEHDFLLVAVTKWAHLFDPHIAAWLLESSKASMALPGTAFQHFGSHGRHSTSCAS